MFITIRDHVDFKLREAGDWFWYYLILDLDCSCITLWVSLGHIHCCLFRSYSLLITHANHDHICLLGLYG